MAGTDARETVTTVVTGGAGFIAATLIPRLLAQGNRVLALDNLSRGTEANMAAFAGDPGFAFVRMDVENTNAVVQELRKHGAIEAIWHLAANSDIPAGIANSGIDLRDTFMSTYSMIEAAHAMAVPDFYFASSSAIYGDLGDTRIGEAAGPLFPISNYGAMKLASEAQLSAACQSRLSRALAFRFPNVVGVPATHGVIFDFIGRLRSRTALLTVLGNGTQRKSYLHVDDLVDAMLFLRDHAPGTGFDAYNIGPVDDGITVRDIAEATVERVAQGAALEFGTEDRGWVGDVPKFSYDTSKLSSLGWQPKLSSREAVLKAIDQIAGQVEML